MSYDSKIVGERIRQARLEREKTVKDLAEHLNVSEATISRYENGIVATIKLPILESICAFLNVTLDYIFGYEDMSYSKLSKNQARNLAEPIPLLGTIAAGQPILAEQNIEDYFNLDKKIKADFCLRIKGDSMINVNILDGDIVFIKKQEDLIDGEIGAVLVDDSATLKRFYRENGSVILQSENSTYKPMVISKGDVKILGKMVASLRQYK